MARSSGITSRSRTQLPEQVGGEAGVAELAHVGAGVGQAEQHAVAGEEPGDAVGVVVGEHRPEAGAQVVLEREVEHHVEGGGAVAAARRRGRSPAARPGRDGRSDSAIDSELQSTLPETSSHAMARHDGSA